MGEKKTISAKEAAAAIQLGMTDQQMMAKFRLTEIGLASLKSKLLAVGLISKDDLVRRSPPQKTLQSSEVKEDWKLWETLS